MVQNAQPAERQRGCFFSENFESLEAINRNRGVVTGALEYRDRGAYFDGTNDYITYPADSSAFGAAEFFSVVVEFTPDFAADDGVDSYLCDSDATTRNYILKRGSAGANALRFVFGQATVIADIPYATYSPHWKQGKRNVLVLSGTSGNTNAWLNGVQILTADSTPWTPALVTQYIVGSSLVSSLFFKGTIHSLKLFGSKVSALTAQEAQDYTNNSTFTYMNRADVILPMRMADHDPSNVRTLDRSGHGNDFTLGDGATPTTFPTKLARRGYTVALGQDFVRTFEHAGNYSLVFQARKNVMFGNRWFFVTTGDTPVAAYQSTVEVITPASPGGSTVYVNGIQTVQSGLGNYNVVVFSGIANSFTSLKIFGGTLSWEGDACFFALIPFALTPLQAIDVSLRLLKQLNEI